MEINSREYNIKEKEIEKEAKQEVKRITAKIKLDRSSAQNRTTKRNIVKNGYKRYAKVYLLYGRNLYLKCVPKKLVEKDLENLYKKGDFITIYERHGEKAFNGMKDKIMSLDIANETGSKFKGDFYRFRKLTSKFIKRSIATLAGVALSANAVGLLETEHDKKEALEKNAQEISEYVDSINNYAEDVKKMNLTNTEVIMKVMDDMWKNIKGYGDPKKDVLGCYGLDLYKKEGVGVCRNMADDVARKLNAIDSKYNARIIIVEANLDLENTQLADINRIFTKEEKKKSEGLDKVREKVTKKDDSVLDEILDETIGKTSGNHAVVIMDVPEDSVTLIVDPTNPAIGTYKDGKIKMFNAKTDDAFKLDRRFIGEEVMCGFESQKMIKEYMVSFLPCKLSDEQLEEKYGTVAQNSALRKFRMNDKNNFFREIEKYYGVNESDTEIEFKKSSSIHIEEESEDLHER